MSDESGGFGNLETSRRQRLGLEWYGQTVAIQHGTYKTVYAHLAGIRVRQGQRVSQGDVIGLVGNTGLTDGQGYVLTFEVRYNGTKQDPRQWLRPR